MHRLKRMGATSFVNVELALGSLAETPTIRSAVSPAVMAPTLSKRIFCSPSYEEFVVWPLDCGGKSSRRRFSLFILRTARPKRRREDLPPQSKSRTSSLLG